MATTMTRGNKRKRRTAKEKLYHYVDSGLKNVYLNGGLTIEQSPYGQAISIIDLDGLHRSIARCLIEKPGPLSGAEFRFLRTELDLSQQTMAQLCGRKERIIREWETRDADVPDPANTIIRVIYRERYDETATYEGMAKKIAQLQKLDKEYFEMLFTPTQDGWKGTKAA
jgi:DNA-binding transcriptional regulator YiaG